MNFRIEDFIPEYDDEKITECIINYDQVTSIRKLSDGAAKLYFINGNFIHIKDYKSIKEYLGLRKFNTND